MSTVPLPPAAAIAAMSPAEFKELVGANLGRDADPALWDDLTSPALRTRTKDCLGAIITDLVIQLQQANSDLAEFQAECFTRGDEGRAEYFAAKGEQADWRRRLNGYRRLVESRMAFVKDRTPRPAQTPSPYGAGFSKNARKHNRAALAELAAAVAGHRRRVISGDGDESDDEALWACLESITAITAGGEELSLAEWLEYREELAENND